MLRTLFDRVNTPTILAGAVLYGIQHLPPWVSLYVRYVVSAAVVFWWLRVFHHHLGQELKIDSLGKRAPSIRTHTPMNVGFMIKALRSVTKHRNLEFWWETFDQFANPARPYTVETVSVGQRIIITADEENIKAILATQFGSYGKGEQFRKEWKDFLGYSIFTTDGALWHDSRSLLRPQFIKDRLSDLHTSEQHVQQLLPLLAGSHDGATVRLDDLAFRYTLDTSTHFLLGRSVESLIHGESEFAHAFNEVQRVQAIMARAGPAIPLVPRKSFDEGLKVLNDFVGRYIDQALELPADELEQKTKTDEGYTFLHAIASYTRDRKVLRDQLVAVLLAGRDTTAVTLSWLFYELSRHPKVVEKLRREIIQTVGLDRQPLYDDLKSMRYLQHSLNETLRLYPVVPFNVRVALEDTTLPHGGGRDGTEPIGIPKDTPIGYSTLVMQRRADIYPPSSTGFPDPQEFAPERWDSWTPRSWTYVPFNGGPRICIGQQFALTSLAYTVVRMLQTYTRVESRQDGFPGLRTDIVLQPQKGVHVAFFKDEKA